MSTLLAAPSAGQPITLVSDLRTTPNPVFVSPTSVVVAGSRVFFVASYPGMGAELWVSDGTPAGTHVVEDVRPGLESSSPSNLTAVGVDVFFQADDGSNGAELWKSDGTEAGTVMVKDIAPGPLGSSPGPFVVAGGVVFFAATGPSSGAINRELWRSDGTDAGTWLVTDVDPLAGSSNPSNLAWLGGALFFAATDAANGQELWKSDGTEAGTVLVKDVRPGTSGSSPRNFTEAGGVVYFTANDGTAGEEPWRTDGTPAGTVLVKDVSPGSGGANLQNLKGVGGTLFFSANDGTNGQELWASTGTPAGTALVEDICAGCSSSPASLAEAGGLLYFTAFDSASGRELWKSDGTAAGTERVSEICAGSVNGVPGQLTPFAGKVYFQAGACTADGGELWVSDGSVAGTALVTDICAGSCSSTPNPIVATATTLFFGAADATHGRQLWTSDGSAAGTAAITHMELPWSFPGSFVELGGALLFAAYENVANTRTLWKTDGSAPGTVQVGAATVSSPGVQVVLGGKAYFSGDAGSGNIELFATDGTDVGTVLVRDIQPGGGASNPSQLTVAGGKLFFVASDGTSGNELWVSDGSGVGTVLVKDIWPGSNNSNIQRITAVGSRVFFAANDGTTGLELWVSDGTPAGTGLVKDLLAGNNNSNPQYLVDVGGTLWFTANDGTGTWIHRSDGTSAGTTVVTNVVNGPMDLTNVGGTVFFSASSGGEIELWKSDGTTPGTVRVADVNPNGSSMPTNLTPLGTVLYFRANDGTSGAELWRTDGTAGRTWRVADLLPGSGSALPRSLTPVGSALYFVANDGVHGEELWKTDGTAAGTFLVQDLNPGAASGNINPILRTTPGLFLTADDGATGLELHLLGAASLSVTKTASSPAPLQGSTLTFTLTVTNAGPTPATLVRLLDPIPAGLTFVSTSPAGTPCLFASGMLNCDLATLAAGASATVEVNTTVDYGFTGTIENTARVAACEIDGSPADDLATAVVTVPGPAAPSHLDALAVSTTSVALTWTPPASTQTGIRVDRSTDGVAFAPVATVGALATAHTDTGLTPGTLYWYRVVAVQAGVGESAPSNRAVARTFPSSAAKVCPTRLGPPHSWSRYPSVAWTGTAWGAAFQARVPGRDLDDVFFRLLDGPSGQPAGSLRNVSDDDMSSAFPTVRWNGSRFAVVFYTGMRTPTGGQAGTVAMAILDASGNVVARNVSLLEAEGPLVIVNDSFETAVAWTGSEWGMVLPVSVDAGGQADLYFVRVSADGDRLGTPIRLTDTPEDERDVSIAWNGTSYGISWAWNGGPPTVRFQVMQSDGTLLGAHTSVFANPSGVAATSTAWNGSGWAVAFVEAGPGPSYPMWVGLAQLATNATLAGAPVRVSPDYDPDFPPEQQVPVFDEVPGLFAKPGNAGYVIFTTSTLNTGALPTEIGRYETDANGTRTGSRTILSTNDNRHSALGRGDFDGSRYLVVYNEGSPGTQEIARVIAGASGPPLAGPSLLTTGGSFGNTWSTATSSQPLSIAVGDGFAVVWGEVDADLSYRLGAKIFDGTGNVAANVRPISTRTFRARPGGVGVGDAFALAWKDNASDVVFGRWNAAGASLVGDVVVAPTQGGRPGVAVAFSGEAYGVVWIENANLAFQRVASDGSLIGSRTTVALGANPNNVSPQVAWTGAGWAVVYILGNNLHYVLLDPAGADSVGPLALTATGSAKGAFSMAWNGTRLGLAFTDDPNVPPYQDILFTSVAPNGAKDFDPVTVASTASNEGQPSLYWDGSVFRLVHTYGPMGILRQIAIFAGDGAVGPHEKLLSNRGGANSVAFNGATAGIAWQQLSDDYFETTACTADVTPPPCPVPAASLNGRAATVSWTSVADAESGLYRYYVYRDGVTLAEVAPGTNLVLDGGFSAGVTHSYQVRAYNGAWLESGSCSAASPATDLTVFKTDGSATEVPGTSVTYTLTVTNVGPSTVSSVTLTDPLPPAIAGTSFNPATGSYDAGTGAWTGLSLGPGQSASMTLTGTIAPTARGTLVNTATVAATTGVVDPNPANDTATDSDTLVPSADLSVAISDSPDPVLQGATLSYVAGVSNAGPSSVAGVNLTITLPAGVAFVSSSPAGPTCTHASGTVVCNLASLAPGASAQVTVNVTPSAGTVGTISATATTSAVEADPAGANNTAATQTTVSGPAPPRDLTVTSRTTTAVSLKWTDPQGSEDHFRIDRSTDGASWGSIAIVDANATTHTDTGRSPATLYYYRIVAVQNFVGESWSNVAATTTLATTAAKVCATRMGPDSASAGGPLPAWGGTSWAIAWTDRRDGLLDEVWFQRFASDGSAALGDAVRVTSTGAPSNARALAWSGSRYGLLWQETMKAQDGTNVFDFRLTAFDAAGNRLQGDVPAFRIEGGMFWSAGSAPLVWNGNGWGVFLTDSAAAPSDARYYRLDAEGRLFGSPVAVTSTPEWEASLSAAWNGSEYGLAFVRKGFNGGSYQVFFQRLAVDGTLLGSPTLVWENSTVSTTSWLNGSTSVAWDAGSWVVAFTDVGPDPDRAEAVLLRRVDASGLPSGVAVRLSPEYDPVSPPEDQVPVVDMTPTLFTKPGGGLVVLTSSFVPGGTGGSVEACRYEANALLERVGTRIQVSTGDTRNSNPTRAASDGSRVLVAWNESRSGTSEIAGALADVSGTVVAGPDELTSGHAAGSSGNPVTVALGTGFGSLYTSTPALGVPTTIAGQFWNGSGSLVATQSSMTDRGVRGGPAAVSLGSTFALAWKDAGNSVLFRRFDATGAPLIPESQVGPPSGGRTNVGLAFSGESYGLAYWSGSTLWFQRVAPDGTSLGSRVTVTTSSANGAPGPQVQWVGTGWAIVWLQSDNLFFARLDAAGTLVVPPIQVTFTPQTEAGYQLLFTGTHLGLAWYEYAFPDPPGGEVYFTVLGLSGIKSFAPVLLGSSDLDDLYPSPYWDVDRFRVVMVPGNPGLLREVAVFPDGSVVPGTRTLATRGGVNGVAWNGATLGISWRTAGYSWFQTTACLADATPPTCPAATAVFDGTRTAVTWTAASDAESGIQGYGVFRDGLRVAEEGATAAAWVDTAPTPGVAHAYVVRARSGAMLESAGCSAASAAADLSVTMTDAPDPAPASGSLTYTLSVTDGGPSAASGVALSVALSAGVSFVSSSPGAPSCTHASGTVTCNLGSVLSGASAIVTIQVGVVGTGPLTSSATVTAVEGDPVAANNSASAVTAVCPATPAASNGGPYCEGSTIALSTPAVPGATYAWTGPAGFTSALQSPTIASATPANGGTYSVTVTVGGCTSPAGTTNVVVNAAPATPLVTAPATVAPEQTFTASVPSVPGVTYAWTVTNGNTVSGDGTREITVKAGTAGPVGISVVETSVATGCGSAAGSVSIPIALPATRFYTVTPCRLFDTREAVGERAAAPALAAGETRTFTIGTRCGLDSATIRSLSVNQTVTQHTADGELVLWRGDVAAVPITSSISFRAGKTRANNGILELSRAADGTFKVHNRSAGTVHFILDVSGYFK